ncbi:MAG: SdpI family protein [Clostridia bacterium]|nr:SdpI family protein [Clostridia bacterium]
MNALLLLNFIIPGVLLLSSVLLKKMKTPYPGPARNQLKWKVDFSGYNTPLSRKSQAHWDYAQQIAPAIFLRRGKQALFSAVCFTLVGLIVTWWVGLAAGIVMGYVGMFLAFGEAEKALKQRFPAPTE